MAVYVMGDLHEQVEAFNLMLKKINFDESKDMLYLVGDFTDGPSSNGPKLILKLIEMSKKGCLKAVLGNHDDMMLDTIGQILNGRDIRNLSGMKFECWMNNLGYESLEQFLELDNSKQMEIYRYLQSLPLFVRFEVNGKKYYVAHAEAYEGGNTFEEKERSYDRSIWGDTRIKAISRLSDKFKNKEPDVTLITGHRITSNYYDYPYDLELEHARIVKVPDKNRILMDCGCKVIQYYDGYALGCLRLDDDKEFYIDEVEVIAGKLLDNIDTILK